ncbi:Hsp20/alpha crystallin family protein [Cooperia oncophora]
MSICILHNGSLPSVLNEVFNELDDALGQVLLVRPPASSPPKGNNEKKAVIGQMGKVTDDGSKFTVALNVSKFKPDELKVNIDGRTLTVEGKQEVKEGSSYTSRSFLRQWTLPEGVDVEQIRSSLTDEGQLAIELPKPKPTINSRSIPITKGNCSVLRLSNCYVDTCLVHGDLFALRTFCGHHIY